MDRLLYSEADAREVLGGISRGKLYQLLADGELTRVKIGRRMFIARDELERYANSLIAAAPSHAPDEGVGGGPAISATKGVDPVGAVPWTRHAS